MNLSERGKKDWVILVAENNEDDFVLVQHVLLKECPRVTLHHVWDGREALDYLNGRGEFADRFAHPLPDLVILDLHLPGTDGFETLVAIRDDPRLDRFPVVVMTGVPEPKVQRDASRLGAHDFYVKPVKPSELRKQVAQICDKWLRHGLSAERKPAPERGVHSQI